MEATIMKCDKCGRQAEFNKENEVRPKGWHWIFPRGKDFCSLECLAEWADNERLPPSQTCPS